MDEQPPLPDAASLSSLVVNLAAAALAYLGKTVLPGTEKAETNLPLAKQTIDTIQMLKAKTEGNRTEDETRLLDDLLYQLRLAYVKAESGPSQAQPGGPPQPGSPTTN